MASAVPEGETVTFKRTDASRGQRPTIWVPMGVFKHANYFRLHFLMLLILSLVAALIFVATELGNPRNDIGFLDARLLQQSPRQD